MIGGARDWTYHLRNVLNAPLEFLRFLLDEDIGADFREVVDGADVKGVPPTIGGPVKYYMR